MKKHDGMTLIEIMIVTAIIVVVVAIALPNMLNARKISNRAAALATLRSFVAASVDYSSNSAEQKYWPNGTTTFGAYFSHVPTKAGYKFAYFANEDASKFVYIASPVSNMSGKIEINNSASLGLSILADIVSGLQSYDGPSIAFFADESRAIWSADGINKTGLQTLENLSSRDIDFETSKTEWRLRNFWFDQVE